MDGQGYFMAAFVAGVAILLALDLGVFHRRSRTIPVGEALLWSSVWVAAALAFNAAILPWRGSEAALQFLTGYLIELSLSVDNLFVFLLLFSRFAVPAYLQHRVLLWGVLGAIVLRVVMIAAGAALIEQFHWVLYLFGLFLAVTGLRMLRPRKQEGPADGRFLAWLARHLPVSATPHDGRFFLRMDGRRMVTPLFVVLLSVEATDAMFAVDSVPAIFAVTTDPFIVMTSNIFAVLGLRSMYFALCGVIGRLHALKYGLAAVLIFIGGRILLADLYVVPVAASLAVTAAILAIAVVASLVTTRGGPSRPGDGAAGAAKPTTPGGRTR